MKRKKKGQFFVDKDGRTHIEKEDGRLKLVRGLKYPNEKGEPMYLVFQRSLDKKCLSLMWGDSGKVWTSSRIRKDGWVTKLIDLDIPILKKRKKEFGYLFYPS